MSLFVNEVEEFFLNVRYSFLTTYSFSEPYHYWYMFEEVNANQSTLVICINVCKLPTYWRLEYPALPKKKKTFLEKASGN